MKYILIQIIILASLLVSCSKKKEIIELKYTVEEFEKLAHETSNGHSKGDEGLNLSEYAPGVNRLESRELVYKRLSFFAVSFEKEEQARDEALRLNQYYSRNWLFDRVEGEPVLEDYVITTFHAINPKRKIQRVPKASGHGGSHGEAHGTSHAAPAHH
ncbi:MAG: hypothetical protein WC635_09225 [Bacteriovorax sp.]|jgi:hypothetical protein